MKYPKILAQIEAARWAITPGALQGIWDIAAQEFDDASLEMYQQFHAQSEEERSAIDSMLGMPFGDSGLSYKSGSTGIIRIDGPIIPRADAFSSASGLVGIDQIIGDFNAFEDDPQIDRILLLWDSPGGVLTGATEVESAIANSKKETISYVYGRAASLAYFIGSASNQIIASPMSEVGSIGVVAVLRISKDSSKIEIVSSQSPFKRPDVTTKEGRSNIQGVVNELNEVFIGTVARNTGVTTAKVLTDFGKGGMVVAERALKVGMIDRIATLESVLNGSNSTEPVTSTVAEISTPPATAGKQESDRMLKEFLKENPSASAEFDEAIKAAREDGHKEGAEAGATAVNSRVEMAMKFVGNENYGKSINALAAKVAAGTSDISALEAAVAVSDEMKEKEESKKATDEGKKGETLAPASDPKAVDRAAELAEDNASRIRRGLEPLKVKV